MSNFENFDESKNHGSGVNLLEQSFNDYDSIRNCDDDEDYYNSNYKEEEKPIYSEKFSEEILSKEKSSFKYDEEGIENEFRATDLYKDYEHSNIINESFKEIIHNIEIKEKISDIVKENKNEQKAPKYPRLDHYKISMRAKINKFNIEIKNAEIKKSNLNEDNDASFKLTSMCKKNENITDTEFNKNKNISKTKTNKGNNTRKGKNQKKNYYNPFNYISRWRTTVNNYFIKKINKVIQDSDLPKELKRIKIYKPNFELFTEKSKKSKVLKELDEPMKDILSLVKPDQIKAKDNEKDIKKIEDFYEENPSESVKKIITLFNKTYRETIEMFYSPDGKEYFNEFKEQNQQKDEKFKDNRGYSLFETNALIRYFERSKKNDKLLGKKRKK